MRPFYFMPEWVCFLITLVLLQISHEIGYRIGTIRRLKPGDNPDMAAGAMSGLTIGLLAFILAFTFNGASTNHDLRKDLLIEESNIVRTTYQRSMQLPDLYRERVRALLEEYVDIRLHMRSLRMDNVMKLINRSKAIQTELWSITLELQKNKPDTPMLGLFTESLNQLFDVNIKRINAVVQGRISSVIWVVLYLLTLITMAMVGYRIGLHGIRSKFMNLSLIISFSLVLVVIIALDKPNGIMRLDTRPLDNVLTMLKSAK